MCVVSSNRLNSVGKALQTHQRDCSWRGGGGLPQLRPPPQLLPKHGSTSALEQVTLVFRVYRLGPFHITSMVHLLLRGCCIFFSICNNRAPEQASFSISRCQTSIEIKDMCGFQHSPPDHVLLILLRLRCFYSFLASWPVSTPVV